MGVAGSYRDEMRSPDRKASFSEAKLRLLEQRIHGAGLQPERGVRPRAPGVKTPLSAEQRRIWLHSMEQPGLPVYNEPVTIRKYGRFDLKILEASFNEILRRHEAWRTSFSSEGEQLVHTAVKVSLPLIDISEMAAAERDAEARRIAAEDASVPISTRTFPLFRAKVVRVSANEHRFYLTFHHIIFDGVSFERIFVPELFAIYTALEASRPVYLSTPPVQYGDYAIWQEQHLDSPEVKEHLAWWLEQLSGELPKLRLPEDHARPAKTNHRGSTEHFSIPKALAESLHRLSRRQGVTLYMTLLAAFNLLLFRYSGQEDFIVGSAADARRLPELENVLGCFVDTFVVRTRPAGKLAFSEYLTMTRESVLGGLAAADVPFEWIVREINPKRDIGRHPIFQVFFTMRPPRPSLTEDWSVAETDVTVGASKFDLHLDVGEVAGGMDARFLYRGDLWERPTIRRMAGHWLELLRAIAANPDAELGSLNMLTREETAELLEPGGWNDTARFLPQETFQALFEEQVRLTPSSIAAVFGNSRWTYGVLNAQAEILARWLSSAGVTRGAIVALVLDRSLDMLACLIAVHKLAAAYLPIDIQLPPARVDLILRDAQPAVILTQRSLQHLTPVAVSHCLFLDDGAEKRAIARAHTSMPRAESDGKDTAYLIYTSGTTGRPKPVEVSQRSLVNLLVSMQKSPGFGGDDILLAVTPISFDIAALELFLPLISGGTVAIAGSDEARNPDLLAKAIRRSRCSVMQATPAMWRTLLLSGWKDATVRGGHAGVKRLRALCGGEPLSGDLADRLLATGAELWNMYGPTETTIWSLIQHVERPVDTRKVSISVGHPVANTTALILDPRRQLQPVGIPGTLFLGGLGLAKGYRGQPQQTAERFLHVASLPGLRLYNTGDVAVRRPDGTIDVLGREDNQVKIRGHRVELEAVEGAILRHPQVADAAARAWPEPSGDMRLSAYIVPCDSGSVPTLADLRTFLAKDLPDSMVPSDVILVSRIPLTAHSKIDRNRLPSPFDQQRAAFRETLRSNEEERIAAIWADLLGGPQVDPEQNFFDLGGHSILLAVLRSRIQKEFGLLISLTELIHFPSIRQQAELVQRTLNGKYELPSGIVALQAKGAGNNLFWIQTRIGSLATEIGEEHVQFLASLTGDDLVSLGNSPKLQNIAACFVGKIVAAQPEGPYAVGGVCLGGIVAYEIACQLRSSGRDVSLLVMIDAQNPSHLDSNSRLSRSVRYLPYGLKRAAQLGPRTSLTYLRDRVCKVLPQAIASNPVKRELTRAIDVIEASALAYKPGKYEGKVLLILASERAPHANLRAGWQAVIPQGLYTRYVDGHHQDLTRLPHVQEVADIILEQLRADHKEG